MNPKEFANKLGIEYPIIQGGMAWVADAELASSVSNGGGLGLIAAMAMNGEELRAEIRRCREMTSRPFGVNVMLMSSHSPEVARVVIEEKIPIITTGAGNPGKYMAAWLEAGIKVIPVVPTVALARRMERAGAFAVVAEGCEAGGHVGELSTLSLLPQVLDAVKIPVIAAGGIADKRAADCVFMLGAAAIQVGTRFLVAHECTIHQNYKDKVIAAGDTDTILTGKRLGHPVRQLKTRFAKEMLAREYDPTVTNEELEAALSGSLRKAAKDGDLLEGSFMAGMSAGLVRQEEPSAAIIRDFFGD